MIWRRQKRKRGDIRKYTSRCWLPRRIDTDTEERWVWLEQMIRTDVWQDPNFCSHRVTEGMHWCKGKWRLVSDVLLEKLNPPAPEPQPQNISQIASQQSYFLGVYLGDQP